MVPYLTAFFVSFAASAALTPLVRTFASRSRFYALPVSDRWHKRPMPLLGGVAMALAFGCGVATIPLDRSLVPLLVCSGLMFALGLADDVRATVPAMKLVGQMVIAGFIVSVAGPISITGWPVIDQLLAFAWIIGITNAFNLLDNMDGLAAGIAALAGACYLALLLPQVGASALTLTIVAFLGAVLGFLIYNYPPASVFMGDSGSHLLGSFLAGVSLLATPAMDGRLVPAAIVPVLVLLVPIFDTTFVTLTRRLSGRSALIGGRDHTSHRLVALGASERVAILSLYALAATGGLLAISLGRVNAASAIGLIAIYVLILGVLTVVLGHVSHPDEQDAGQEPPFLWEIAYRRRNLELMLDIGLLTLAYYAAFRLRFYDSDASSFFGPFVRSVPAVVAAQVAGLYAAGKYRQVWRMLTTPELWTLMKGVLFGVTASVMLIVGLYRLEGFSRGVFALDALIAFCLLVASRGAASSIDDYLRKRRASGSPALIYGAGRGGALLVRELLQNRDMQFMPVGFVDDDLHKQHLVIEGLPVLGTLDELGSIASRHGISELLVAIRDLDPGHLEDLLRRSNEHGLTVRRMRFSVDEVRPAPRSVRL